MALVRQKREAAADTPSHGARLCSKFTSARPCETDQERITHSPFTLQAVCGRGVTPSAVGQQFPSSIFLLLGVDIWSLSGTCCWPIPVAQQNLTAGAHSESCIRVDVSSPEAKPSTAAGVVGNGS